MEYLKEGYKDSRLSWVPMAAWLNVYNRDFLNKNKLRFKYGILHEDEEFTPRVLLVADKIIYSGVRFYHYVVRNDSITTKIDKRKNIKDFTDTALELEEMYKNIEDIELQKYMRDSLARKYLSIYWSGRIYKYGSRYTNRRFVMRNANNINTRMKAILFFLSPAIYCGINDFFKKICESR
jgi:hypothetical protein